MANRRPGWARTFKKDSQLLQYFLENVVPTGKTLGVGSYGSVVEVHYSKVACAAKRMHELLLDPGNEGVRDTVDRYRRECQLMAGFRHPNITQFLGLCFLEGFELPLLVMEKLEMSVDDLLECAPNIPLPVKISILTDTSSGLVYLHSRTPPIVHRDLTARNVLLTASLTAKITDMGNSRMVTLRPSQLAQTLSKNPGTTVYMPPEALSESHRYGPSLDVFSFGHLALYAFTQVFPGELLIATRADPNNPGRLLGRTEVERREVYMKKLESQLLESHPILVELVTNCLHNNPQARPSADQLLETLQVLQNEVEKNYGENIGRLLNVTNVLHIKNTKQKNQRIKELEVSEGRLEAEIARLEDDGKMLETENRQLKEENRRMETELNRVLAENNQLKAENHQLQIDINRFKTEVEQLNQSKDQLAADKLQLESRHREEKLQLESRYCEEKQALIAEVERLKREKQSTTTGSDNISHGNKPITFPLQLDWRRGPDMPVAMSKYIQSIEINGTVYVGGGVTDRSKDDYIVMAYSTQSCQWHSLSPYTTRGFTMTNINSKLVLVGGRARDDYSSELGEWQPDSNQWTRPFPPMSTPCWGPSATSYKHWLVVAGGRHGDYLHSIEVLDVSNMQWSTRPSPPTPWSNMKSTTLGDTWYLMGGYCSDVGLSPDIYSVSLEALVSQSASDSSSLWRKLPSLDCIQSCPLIIGGSLLAVGGWDMKSKKPVSTIQCYVPETNSWVQAGLLPHAVCACTCITTSNKLHVMGGHDGKTTSKQLFISNLS